MMASTFSGLDRLCLTRSARHPIQPVTQWRKGVSPVQSRSASGTCSHDATPSIDLRPLKAPSDRRANLLSLHFTSDPGDTKGRKFPIGVPGWPSSEP